jgi:hypothetical protein
MSIHGRIFETLVNEGIKAETANVIGAGVAELVEKTVREAVAAERAAILELIESERANGHLYDGDYCLRAVAADIKARGEQK